MYIVMNKLSVKVEKLIIISSIAISQLRMDGFRNQKNYASMYIGIQMFKYM